MAEEARKRYLLDDAHPGKKHAFTEWEGALPAERCSLVGCSVRQAQYHEAALRQARAEAWEESRQQMRLRVDRAGLGTVMWLVQCPGDYPYGCIALVLDEPEALRSHDAWHAALEKRITDASHTPLLAGSST